MVGRLFSLITKKTKTKDVLAVPVLALLRAGTAKTPRQRRNGKKKRYPSNVTEKKGRGGGRLNLAIAGHVDPFDDSIRIHARCLSNLS
jgi:hypothetical protein